MEECRVCQPLVDTVLNFYQGTSEEFRLKKTYIQMAKQLARRESQGLCDGLCMPLLQLTSQIERLSLEKKSASNP